MTPERIEPENVPWPYTQGSARARRLAARLALFGAVVLLVWWATSWGAERLATAIAGGGA